MLRLPRSVHRISSGISCLTAFVASVYKEQHGALSLTRSQRHSIFLFIIFSHDCLSPEKIVRSNTDGQFSCHFRYTGDISPFVYMYVNNSNS